MTSPTTTAQPRRTLLARVGFALLTSILVTLLASSSAPTPLYATYIICYLAMGLPAILAGVRVAHSTVTRTAREFGVAIIALAAITAVGTIRSAGKRATALC
jgi:hypothetical protein